MWELGSEEVVELDLEEPEDSSLGQEGQEGTEGTVDPLLAEELYS